MNLTATKDILHSAVFCGCGNRLEKGDSEATLLLGLKDASRCFECREIVKGKNRRQKPKKQIEYRCSECGAICSYGSASLCKKCYRMQCETNLVKRLKPEDVEQAIFTGDINQIEEKLGISNDRLTRFFPVRTDLRDAYVRGMERKFAQREAEAKLINNGRPPKVFDYEELEEATATSKTDLEIADKLGIHRNTFNRHKQSDIEFIHAYHRGLKKRTSMTEKMTVTNTQTVEQKIVVEKSDALELPDKIVLKIEATKEQYERLCAISLDENYPIQKVLDNMLKEFIENDYDWRAGELESAVNRMITNVFEPKMWGNTTAINRNEAFLFLLEGLKTSKDIDELQSSFSMYMCDKLLESMKPKQ